MIKLTFFFAAIVIGIPFIINEAEGELQWWTNTDIRDPSDGKYKAYVLFENSGFIQVRTNQGSFIYDKNLCEISFFAGRNFANEIIGSDSYEVFQSVSGSGIWNDVSQINDATCTTQLIADGINLEIIGTKFFAGIGEFKVHYIKERHKDLKTMLEATNFSGLTNRQFKIIQTINVPQVINFAGVQRDLSNLNGTTFDRDFVLNNKAEVVSLFNKVDFDLTQGFNKFESLQVIYENGLAFLVIDYARNAPILLPGETIFLDPSFGWHNGIDWRVKTALASGASCSAIGGSSSIDNTGQIVLNPTGNAECRFASLMFNGLSTPFPTPIIIIDAIIEVQTVATLTAGRDCEFRDMNNDPANYPDTVDGRTALILDIQDGDIYASSITRCTSIGTSNVTLNTAGIVDLETEINQGQEWWGVGVPYENLVRDGGTHATTFGTERLSILFSNGTAPDAVTDLVASNPTTSTVDLDWSAPNLQGGIFAGYQINFTTPFGNPRNLITNATDDNTTSFAISGLNQGSDYSFRVSAWTNVTNNATGNIANITTTSLGNFTVGFFELNATNPDARDFKFERVDLNTTHTNLEVTYPNTFNSSCNFSYKFAMINNTYSNLATVPTGTDELLATFQFQNIQNEVIKVRCTDEITGTTAPFLLTITDFPLLQQFVNFTSGIYGTEGDFGAIDLVTLSVIIIMMVGFNRSNESVGAIFAVIVLGFFAFFDIVEWFSFMFGTFAVVIMLTIASTRKM